MAEKSCVQLNESNCTKLLDSIDTILADCDGVLYHMNTVISGVPEAVQKLKKKGKRVFYVTNNSSKTREEFCTKLQAMGYPAEKDDVIGSAYTTAQYLIGEGAVKNGKKAFVIGHDGLIDELTNAGIKCVRPLVVAQDKMSDPMKALESFKPDPEVGYVVAGIDVQFNYIKACMVSLYLKNKDVKYIATNTDPSIPVARDIFMPGAGSIQSMISTATGRQPDAVCGKPQSPMFDVVKNKYSLNPSRTLMVGDRLDTDILFAGRCGLKSLLVLTGSSNLQDVQNVRNTVEKSRRDKNCRENITELLQSIPDYHIASLADVAKLV